jgi:competence protein ComEA
MLKKGLAFFIPSNALIVDQLKIDSLNRLFVQKEDTVLAFESEVENPFEFTKPDENKLLKKISAPLQSFDPNSLSDSGWLAMGFLPYQINSLRKYQAKGGKFKKPEDLAKLYFIKPDIYTLLQPYIAINQEITTNPTQSTKPIFQKTYKIIDLAFADTLELQELPGIGPGYAKRIAAWRHKLGGFYSIDQVAETWDLPDSVFQRIRPYICIKDTNIKLLNLNVISYKDLRNHPYCNEDIARVFIQYRNLHGPFKRTEDIKKIGLMDDDLYRKLAPYLIVIN